MDPESIKAIYLQWIDNRARYDLGETPVAELIRQLKQDYDPVLRVILSLPADWLFEEDQSITENERAYLLATSAYETVEGLTRGTKLDKDSVGTALKLRIELEGLVRSSIAYGYNKAAELAKSTLKKFDVQGVSIPAFDADQEMDTVFKKHKRATDAAVQRKEDEIKALQGRKLKALRKIAEQNKKLRLFNQVLDVKTQSLYEGAIKRHKRLNKGKISKRGTTWLFALEEENKARRYFTKGEFEAGNHEINFKAWRYRQRKKHGRLGK